jgi:serine/threonine protein kinase
VDRKQIGWTDKLKRLNWKEENIMPKHENLIKNFVNVEMFYKNDSKQKDFLGWITIMEKGGDDLRTILKEERIGLDERKKIAKGIMNGLCYLNEIGIEHLDLKMENILMVNGIPKIIDYGLVREDTGRIGYCEMGFARRGSKFRNEGAICKFFFNLNNIF